MNRALITGAGGAIGKALTDYFIKNTSFDLTLNYFSENEIPQNIKENINLKVIVGDISKEEILQNTFENVDVLIHLASSVNPKGFSGKWAEAFNFGANSTFAILDYLREYQKPMHILFPSSGGTVYNDFDVPHKETEVVSGESPYGIQKIMFENYFRLLCKTNKNITCNILRIANIFGMNLNEDRKQGFIDVSVHKIMNNLPLEIWVPLETGRDYIYKEDVCECFKKAIDYKNGFEIFNVGSGKETTIKELLELFEQMFGNIVKYEEKQLEFKTYFPQKNVLDIIKTKSVLNWKPQFIVRDGIKKVINEGKNLI